MERHLTAVIADKQKQIDYYMDAAAQHYDAMERWRRDAKEWNKSAIHWRQVAEEAQNTPEARADTEAAFRRGAEHKTKQLAAWFQQQAASLYASLDEEEKSDQGGNID